MRGQHTPGPWRVRRFDRSETMIMPDRPDGREALIAMVSIGRHHPDGEANVDLIAAAPDLLEGARELVALLRRMPNAGAILAPQTTGLRVLTQAEAAIAKATGGSA